MNIASDSFTCAQAFWDAAARTYDDDFSHTIAGEIRRRTVWRDLERLFHAPQRVLELNCGTGLDAIHLAKRGTNVVACDISREMIEISRRNALAQNVAGHTSFRVLKTEDLEAITPEEPFDGAFSNFAGLNCVADLRAAAQSLYRLLKPGTPALIVMMGRFVPWEILWFLAHREPAKALRRLSGCPDGFESGPIKIHLRTVREIESAFAPGFRLKRWKGIGILVGPTYMDRWFGRHPRLTRILGHLDERIGHLPFFRHMADCILLEFRKIPSDIDNG